MFSLGLTHSDMGFGVGVAALLAFGWDSAPEVQARHQTPMAELTLTMLHERHVENRRCEALGTIQNTGSAGTLDGELRLTFYADENGAERILTAGTLQITNLAQAESRRFTIPYHCDAAIGSRRYRAYVEGAPARLRAGLRRVFAGG